MDSDATGIDPQGAVSRRRDTDGGRPGPAPASTLTNLDREAKTQLGKLGRMLRGQGLQAPIPKLAGHRGRKREETMKIVFIGGSGLIATKLLNRLREQGHEVIALRIGCVNPLLQGKSK